MSMEKGNDLFLLKSSDDFRYCLYRVCQPEGEGEDENCICGLDEPIIKVHDEACPVGMSAALVGTKLFLVGGYYACSEKGPFRLSNETIVFDTLSNTHAPGPALISPKPDPFLFTVGGKLFALSSAIYADGTNRFVGPKPRFEVLNADHLESGWRALSVPRLFFTKQHNIFHVKACVALSTGIFISVEDAGTYVFDLDKEIWNYVSKEPLPFSDQAIPMPPNLPGAPASLCFAVSSKTDGYSVFRVSYEAEGIDDTYVFKVDEIEFDTSLLDLAKPLPPLIYYEWPLISSDNGSVVYLIDTGLDNLDAHDTNEGNRYIKVQACEVEFSKRRLSRKLGKRKSGGRRREHGLDEEKEHGAVENMGEFSFSRSRGLGGGGVLTRGGGVVKSCTNEQKRKFEDGEEKAIDEAHKFKLNPIWRRSFFGGPMVDIGEHAYAAFAIKRWSWSLGG